MSELPEQMYCSEQICIPPSFPYLLRQYAKAAIRTQPTDLLTWSTAYFRCLSFNIPPPVKTRLEYPLPHNYYGVTPGWLKALTNQFLSNLFLRFKVLWDRWMGACLQHNTLIKVLCLGQFDQPESIPWIKVMAICAGCLTDNLTRTMILICEILSEGPEGGSAMIPLETFISLYEFLAKIDASKDQMLKNYYFRDSLLDLFKEKVEKFEEEEARELSAEPSEISEPTKSSSKSTTKSEKSDVSQKISCPSLPEDDQYSLKYLLKDEPSAAVAAEEQLEEEEEQEEEETEAEAIDLFDTSLRGSLDEEQPAEITAVKEEQEEAEGGEEEKKDDGEQLEHMEKRQSKDEADEAEVGEADEVKKDENEEDENEQIEEDKMSTDRKEGDADEPKTSEAAEETSDAEKEKMKTITEEDSELQLKEYESIDTIVGEKVRDLGKAFEDEKAIKEDLERLKALQQEMAGETDDELEKYKCQLIADMPLTESQQEGIKHFQVDQQSLSSEEKSKVIFPDDVDSEQGENLDGVVIEAKEPEDDKDLYDEVFVEAIPGIGGIIPDEIINAVKDYMKECAKNQHGMVMPRNIRHSQCPPLESCQ